MSKGTAAQGKKNKQTHTDCRRCGRHAFHIKKGVCAACGFGKTKKRKDYNWANKKSNKSRERKD